MRLTDPWQKFLSAFGPKNSRPSEQLVRFTLVNCGCAARADWLLGSQTQSTCPSRANALTFR